MGWGHFQDPQRFPEALQECFRAHSPTVEPLAALGQLAMYAFHLSVGIPLFHANALSSPQHPAKHQAQSPKANQTATEKSRMLSSVPQKYQRDTRSLPPRICKKPSTWTLGFGHPPRRGCGAGLRAVEVPGATPSPRLSDSDDDDDDYYQLFVHLSFCF